MTLDDALATLHELVHYDADPVYDLAPSIEALECVEAEIARLREERDALIRDRERWRLEWQAEVKAAEAENKQLRDGLRRIRQWDCLNPPRADLLADLPWLAREIDALLAEDGAATQVTAALDDTDPLDAIRQAIYMGDNGQECVCSEHGGKCYMHAQQERAEAALDILAKQPAYLKEGLRDGIERLERSACRDVTEPVLRDLRALLAEDGAATAADGGPKWTLVWDEFEDGAAFPVVNDEQLEAMGLPTDDEIGGAA